MNPGTTNDSQWYARRPVGIHTIEKFLSTMTSKMGTKGRFTPHSLRATTATRLYESGFDEQLIQEQTGHSSTAVRSYKRTSSIMKQEVSKTLQQPSLSSIPDWLPTIAKANSDEEFVTPKKKTKLHPTTTSRATTSTTSKAPPSTSVSTSNTTHVEQKPATIPSLSNFNMSFDTEKKIFSVNFNF